MSSRPRLNRMAIRNARHLLGRRRGGWSLVELLVVTALSGVILSAVGLTLRVGFRADRQLRGEMIRRAALERFGRQLRVDAHRAERVQTPVSDRDLRLLRTDGTTAHYRTIDSGVERRLLEGEQIRHRELFRLPGVRSARWETVTEPVPLVRLWFGLTDSEQDPPAGPGHVFEAALGLDDPSDWTADNAADQGQSEGGGEP